MIIYIYKCVLCITELWRRQQLIKTHMLQHLLLLKLELVAFRSGHEIDHLCYDMYVYIINIGKAFVQYNYNTL